MSTSLLLQFTGDTTLFRIIDFLIDEKGLDFSKTDIARGSNVSRSSVFNAWSTLEKFGVVRQTRQYGKTRLYTLNGSSPITKKLLALEEALITQSMRKRKTLAKV